MPPGGTLHPMRIWVLLLLVGCMEPYDPFHGAEPFTPPTVYREWWAMVETCSGKTGDFSAVQWYTKETLRTPTTIATADYTAQAVVLTPATVMDAQAVRHEMGHLLIKEPGHPLWFAERCGSIVSDW